MVEADRKMASRRSSRSANLVLALGVVFFTRFDIVSASPTRRWVRKGTTYQGRNGLLALYQEWRRRAWSSGRRPWRGGIVSQVKPTGSGSHMQHGARGVPVQSLRWISLRATHEAAAGTDQSQEERRRHRRSQGTMPRTTFLGNDRNVGRSQCSRYEGTWVDSTI